MTAVPATHSLTFSGALLKRGFWIYVWEVEIDPTTCRFVFYTSGPYFVEDARSQGDLCDVSSALECTLAKAMVDSGYEVINSANSLKNLDVKLFQEILSGFVAHFPKLAPRLKK